MKKTDISNKDDLFQHRSSSNEFLLSKADLKPSLKSIHTAEIKEKDDEKDILNNLFPGMQSGENFLEYAMKQLAPYLAFGAMIIRIDDVKEPDQKQKTVDTDKVLSDIAGEINEICKAENGFWGRLSRFEFACYFPDVKASECLNYAVKFKTNIEKSGTNSVTTGIAAYPAFIYRKNDIIINAKKALAHADFFGPGSIVAFDAVSLNISGDKLYQDGDIDGAIKEFKTALLFDPDNVNVHNSLGVCYGVLGDFVKAIKEFKEAVRFAPKEIMPLYNLGLVYQLVGKREKALKYFLKAGDLGEELFEIDFQTGKLLLELGKTEEGNKCLEKASNLKPESSVALFYLGESFVATGMMDEAEDAYKKAIKINPDDAASLSSLGWLYEMENKNSDVSFAFCSQSVEIEPDNGLFRQRLGRLYQKKNLVKEALSEFVKAEQLGCESRMYIKSIKKSKSATIS
ncbi:MAG: tetratricopeptide repeat protein [Proteobacteria bacterium]|nr:tetratricopeptide repeat protein [Pseudomonadota bacterium]